MDISVAIVLFHRMVSQNEIKHNSDLPGINVGMVLTVDI